MNHLNDQELQAYLDGVISDKQEKIEQHIKSCTRCQNSLRAYQEIYRVLKNEPMPHLSVDFAAEVAADMKSKIENRSQLKETILLLAFFLVGSGVSFYFVNPLPGLWDTFKEMFSGMLQFIDKIIPVFNGHASIIILAVLILILVGILDKKILKI
jgi:anti-sigma factor RsiW